MATTSARGIVLKQAFPSYDNQHVRSGLPQGNKPGKTRHQTTIPQTVSASTAGRYLPGLLDVFNEHGQNSQRWHHIRVHKNRCHGLQRGRCSNNMQGQAHPHRGARQTTPIPNTVDATTGTVATKAPIQTSA